MLLNYVQKTNITEFEESDAAVSLIRTINRLFDIFNTPNLLGFRDKKPLSNEEYSEIFNQL